MATFEFWNIAFNLVDARMEFLWADFQVLYGAFGMIRYNYIVPTEKFWKSIAKCGDFLVFGVLSDLDDIIDGVGGQAQLRLWYC